MSKLSVGTAFAVIFFVISISTAVVVNHAIRMDFGLSHTTADLKAQIEVADATLTTFDLGITLAGALLIAMSIGLRERTQKSQPLGPGLASCVGITSGVLVATIYLGIFGRITVTRLLSEEAFDARLVEGILLVQFVYLAFGFMVLFTAGVSTLGRD